jgi:hypothetical protein
MDLEMPFACVATDSGLASEFLHVSPVYVRVGPPKRGVFDDRRATRSRRTDARQAQRPRADHRRTAEAFDRFFEPVS